MTDQNEAVGRLTKFWGQEEFPFDPNSSETRYVHPKDCLPSNISTPDPSSDNLCVRVENLNKCKPSQFHLCLAPVPYLGNLTRADIFMLLLNPSVGYSDYSTDADPRFRQALDRNLKANADQEKCLALDRDFWWTSWFGWFERLLRNTICEYGERAPYFQTLDALSRRTAIIELVPYYSQVANRITVPFVEKLESAKMAKLTAEELRKDAGKLVIVRWGAKKWGLVDNNGHVVCESGRGFGRCRKAILDWLKHRPL